LQVAKQRAPEAQILLACFGGGGIQKNQAQKAIFVMVWC
jgi:hypothetical protein